MRRMIMDSISRTEAAASHRRVSIYIFFIEKIEENTGIKAVRNYLPLQAGDVEETMGCIEKAKQELGYNPKVSLEEGVKRFVHWYKEFQTQKV